MRRWGNSRLLAWLAGVGLLGWGLWLSACASTPTPPLPLRLEATDLAAPLLTDLTQAYAGTNVIISAMPAATLDGDLAAGRADLGLAVTYPSGQFATPLGYVSFVVVVNPANPVSRLTVAQLRDTFAGRATDWGQVGGSPGPIQVVSREDGSDAAAAFSKVALLGEAPTLNALVAPDWDAMRQAISQTPGAVGYLPAPELQAPVKAVGLEVDLRALVVAVAPKTPTGAARDFLAWAQSEPGQAVVARRFGPVR